MRSIGLLTLAVALLGAGCSKPNESNPIQQDAPTPETQTITTDQLKNCRFQNPKITYAYQSKITPNPIICDQGVPRKVELISPTPLPSGLLFSMNELSLVGTANEKVIKAPFQYYLQNEAGYVIVKLEITVN